MNNNRLKHLILNQIASSLDVVSSKIAILEALDNDSSDSGHGDLNDQLLTMFRSADTLHGATMRAEGPSLCSR
jgi:hypothetical protein